MTLDQRIEAAARAIDPSAFMFGARADDRYAALAIAREAMKAAFPERFKEAERKTLGLGDA